MELHYENDYLTILFNTSYFPTILFNTLIIHPVNKVQRVKIFL